MRRYSSWLGCSAGPVVDKVAALVVKLARLDLGGVDALVDLVAVAGAGLLIDEVAGQRLRVLKQLEGDAPPRYAAHKHHR